MNGIINSWTIGFFCMISVVAYGMQDNVIKFQDPKNSFVKYRVSVGSSLNADALIDKNSNEKVHGAINSIYTQVQFVLSNHSKLLDVTSLESCFFKQGLIGKDTALLGFPQKMYGTACFINGQLNPECVEIKSHFISNASYISYLQRDFLPELLAQDPSKDRFEKNLMTLRKKAAQACL